MSYKVISLGVTIHPKLGVVKLAWPYFYRMMLC